MNRRALLVGTGAAAVVIATGEVVGERSARARRLLHQVGLLDGADHAPPKAGATVRYQSFRSEAMGRDVRWGLALPRGEAAGTIVCLHGRNGDERTAFETMGIHQFVADARLPLAVASVDGGADSYWHLRADGTNAVVLVRDELLPRLPPGPVVLLGWSMGGYGAVLLASRSDDRVQAVVAASPAVWHHYSEAAPGAFDGPEDFRTNDPFRVQLEVQGRIECGFDDPFATAADDLRQALGTEGGLRAGFHDAPTWRSWVPDQLDFIAGALDLPAPRHA